MPAKNLLVVEDEKPLRNALQLKLTAAGYTVTAVENGELAMKELETGTFDLVLTDLIMPRTDGFALLEYAKKKAGAPPVIVMSNLEQEEDSKRAEALGAKAYIVKSNTPLTKIIEKIQEVLT